MLRITHPVPLAAASAAFAVAATIAVAAPQASAPQPRALRVAVIADQGLGPAATAHAVAAARAALPAQVVVRRPGGALDAQGQAAQLAAEGYDVVVGAGPDARAAVAQARAAGLAGGATRFVAVATR